MTLTAVLIVACSLELQERYSCHQEMVRLLKTLRKKGTDPGSLFNPEAKLVYMDSLLSVPHSTPDKINYCRFLKANILLELGREKEAIKILEKLLKENQFYNMRMVRRSLAMAYLRQGERSNCVDYHAAESCILPIQNLGVHVKQDGSREAISVYQDMLREDARDLESRWLLNIAYMTVGEYPSGVPEQYLIAGLDSDTTYKVKPFEDIAGDLKLDIRNMAGGSIVEDFDNDGLLDILVSSWGLDENMRYFRNTGDGHFADQTEGSGLMGITGGLNLIQGDYDNDGYADVFVLRGAWKGEYGREPNSLLRNNGDGTFTDMTTHAGLLSFHPTQTATWSDFNNDGWLDLFIGNESQLNSYQQLHPCELYINNQDGTFREVATVAKCDIKGFVKGVTSGDYDNDGWMDIFLSTMDGNRILLKNQGMTGTEIAFADVTQSAGLDKDHGRTFTTWFWDYNNDGWLDIFTSDYTFDRSLSAYMAAEYLGVDGAATEKMLLYRNNRDGTFTNVAGEAGLNQTVFAMGANFGDIDNDGYLDMYLGTGNPRYQSLVPNKLFKSVDGKQFVDVTTSARVGHLQKGHGVSFADLDNDGDQDIYIEMGGAYPGDAYQNSFFMNPGQNENNWICLRMEGVKANRLAIGSRVRITFRENGVSRSVYRDVNSGGSFGSSPLRREIGVGQASLIDEIEIRWHGSGTTQVLRNIKPNQFITIREEQQEIEVTKNKLVEWILPNRLCYSIDLTLGN